MDTTTVPYDLFQKSAVSSLLAEEDGHSPTNPPPDLVRSQDKRDTEENTEPRGKNVKQHAESIILTIPPNVQGEGSEPTSNADAAGNHHQPFGRYRTLGLSTNALFVHGALGISA
jgi:hypothetical protein